MSEWISVKEELPLYNGSYEVTNNPDTLRSLVVGICYYDGFGFLFENIYRPILFGRKIISMEKRYGTS